MKKGRILIVDDEASIRSLLNTVLDTDYTVSEADSGAALKKLLLAEPVDVILLDLNLKDSHGLELLPLIKKSWPDTEGIVLTGEATYDTAVQAAGGTPGPAAAAPAKKYRKPSRRGQRR